MRCMQGDFLGIQELCSQCIFQRKQLFYDRVLAVNSEQSCFSKCTSNSNNAMFFDCRPVVEQSSLADVRAFGDLSLGEFFSFRFNQEVKDADDCVVTKELHEQGVFFHVYLIEKVV